MIHLHTYKFCRKYTLYFIIIDSNFTFLFYFLLENNIQFVSFTFTVNLSKQIQFCIEAISLLSCNNSVFMNAYNS